MYSINYKSAIESLLVPDKRTPRTTAFNSVLVKEVANNHEILFDVYKSGLTSGVWVAGTYANRMTVQYGKSVFQSLKDGNTDEPTTSTTWRLISDNFLGNDFRLLIRGEKLVLEYALNRWFNTIFRNPPLVSEIYLSTNTAYSLGAFRVGKSEYQCSKVFKDTSSEFIINSYTFLNQYNLTIFFPLAVYNALGTNNNERDSIIKDFTDKYISAGITYQITTY